jgi:hypothetical protein
MPDETPQPFETREDFEAAETKVLHPETDARKIAFGMAEVEIRALPIRVERQIMALITDMKGAEQESNIERLYQKAIGACRILAEFYMIPGATEEWIADHIGIDQAIEILNKQAEVGNASRFLESALRSLFGPMRAFCAGLVEADLTMVHDHGRNLFRNLGEQPQPTPHSAKPGTSA